MGIVAEYCPDLALRIFGERNRLIEECFPEKLVVGNVYNFLKKGQKHYWLIGEIPFRETEGNGIMSKPKASIKILEATHFIVNGSVWTKGTYEVMEVYSKDDNKIHFDGLEKIK